MACTFQCPWHGVQSQGLYVHCTIDFCYRSQCVSLSYFRTSKHDDMAGNTQWHMMVIQGKISLCFSKSKWIQIRGEYIVWNIYTFTEYDATYVDKKREVIWTVRTLITQRPHRNDMPNWPENLQLCGKYASTFGTERQHNWNNAVRAYASLNVHPKNHNRYSMCLFVFHMKAMKRI